MLKNFLESSSHQLSQRHVLTIHSLDKKCSKIHIRVEQKIQGENDPAIYQQTIQVSNISKSKPQQSILFLKLMIQCSLSKGYQNSSYLKYQKVNNLVWQKIIIGKDKVDAVMQQLRKPKPNKKYEGIILQLTHPEYILIVLPKMKTNQIAPRIDYKKMAVANQQQQVKIKKMFYSTLNQ